MGRPTRQLKKTFVLFCEGTTEYNYFNGMKSSNLNIIIKPINMQGGGYKSFLQAIRKESSLNRIATFVIVDGDRACNIATELKALQDLQNYCHIQNKRDNLSPFFLIVNSPDFEYVACLHDSLYSKGDTTRHIKNIFHFAQLSNFKNYTDIYNFLNKESRSFENVIQQLKNHPKLISNEYEKKGVFILWNDTITNWDLIGQRNSNIEELFEIVTDHIS